MSLSPLVCRVCLATDRNMFNATLYKNEFRDLTGVTISASDELPQWLCYECKALLQKCVRFRNKAMQSHYVITQHIQWSIPITCHKDTSSYLSTATTEHCDILGTLEEQLEDPYAITSVEVKDEVVTQLNALVGDIYSKNVKVKDECPTYDEITLEEWGVDHQNQTKQIEVSQELTNTEACQSSGQTNEDTDTTSMLNREDDEDDISFSDDTDTDNSPKKAFPCKQCKKSFDTNDLLTAHVQEHYRPYKCEVCSRKLSSKNSYSRHIRIHTAERPHKCHICTKSFITMECLQKHQRIHFVGRPYQCEICLKSYRCKSELNVHSRKHSDDKPYKCDICGKGFIINGHLKNHMRTHRFMNM